MTSLNRSLSLLALATLCAAGCSADSQSTPVRAAANEPRAVAANAVAAQIADTLQACSYDGRPVRFGMGNDAPRDCRDMIAEVMNFTGLPQNFAITEADVPNAAAAILLDRQKLPHRVIAFNPQFIDLVHRETGNAWAAVSIMAHEVGHHLAGHTIQPGGSQPPIELEADKFSGFVLYKMGAGRDDTLAAIRALVPASVPADSTHPARAQRVAAIGEGWDQACAQTGRSDCSDGVPGGAPAAATAGPTAQSPVAPVPMQPVPGNQAAAPLAETPAAPPKRDDAGAIVLPKPDARALPSKGMQFVYDEFGLLDRAELAKWERAMFEHARTTGVEIVTLLVRDLHGMSAEDYAWAMMRQLRVGKLDVGNGAVLVLAPQQGEVGHAFGPGVAQQLETRDPTPRQKRWIDFEWKEFCLRKQACNAYATESLLSPARSIMDNTRDVAWTIRYASYADLVATHRADFQANRGRRYDPARDHTTQALARVDGTIVRINPADRDLGARVNDALVQRGWLPVHLRTDAGENVMFYVGARTQALMPGGALREGKRYAAIGRVQGLSWNPKDTGSLYLLSYVER